MRNSNTCRERATHRGQLRKWLTAGTAILCLVHAVFALDPRRSISQYVHDEWGADRGFLGGEIYAIAQSSDGYLWIGTERGLVRFDGFNFVMIQRPLPDLEQTGPVRDLITDAEGNMWIRLEGPRMLWYRNGKFENVYSHFDLQDITFTAIARDNEGGILLAGLGDRTIRYRDGRFTTVIKAEDNPGTVMSLAETRGGRLWLGTREDGLFRVDHGHATRIVAEPEDSKINALLPADSGGLWIGTDHGLQLWDGNHLTKPDLPPSMRQLRVLALAKDYDGNIWAGTDHGVLRISPGGSASLDPLIPDSANDVTATYVDRNGDLWLGGSRGIERLRNGMFTTYSKSNGLPSESNGPVYVDAEGRTWFAPLAGGLYWMKDGRVGSITVDGLGRDVVYSISGGNGEIWVGRQRGGLTVLRANGDSFFAHTYTHADGLAQDSVYSVHRNRDGSVWAGTVSAGVSRLEGGRFTSFSEVNGLPSNSVNSIVEGDDSTMWLATPNGLASYKNGVWTNRSARDGLPSPNVKTIFEDSRHVLWIETIRGLAFLEDGKIQTVQRLPDELREQIFGIAEDAVGSLWFATSDHVLQVNRDQLLKGTVTASDVQSYGIGDGLAGVEGVGRDRSMVADHSGRIWVSLNRGLSVADPKITLSNSTPAMVRVESMTAGGEEVDPGSMPRLSSGVESIVFNYASTNLASLERERFRYKLDGSDHGWSDSVASRQVVYSNLSPGSYRFRIIAASADGLWNGQETVIPFIIEPAFWQTWQFRVTCVAASILVIVALYRLRMYQMARKLNLRFQERLAERTRIAQELHDTLLQGVLSASLQLDVADDQLAEESPAKPMVRRVLQLMRKVTEEGRNALRGLRAAETDSRNLEMAFSRIRQEFVVDEKIGYRVIVNSAARPLRPMIRDEVYRIGREALVNAFMHADANSIEVEVEYASKHLRVLVRDDGCGIDPQVLHSGREGHWGLPGMRERSEGIGASLRLRSRVGAGTEVELTVPSAIAFENDSHTTISQWLPWLSREKFETSTTDKKK